jgi:ELWxxDGT repeat protein
LLDFRRLGLETLEQRCLLSVVADNPDTLLRGVELTSPGDVISVRYDLPPLVIQPTGEIANGQALSQATMAGTEQSDRAGTPMLPLVPVEIVVPAGRSVASVDVLQGATIALPGSYAIEVAAEPELLGPYTEAGSAEMFAVPSSEPTSGDTSSESPLEVVGVQRQRGVDILMVNLHPVRYAAATGSVSYYTTLTLNVTLSNRGSPWLDGGLAAPCRTDELQSLKPEVANPSDLESYLETPAPLASLSTAGICNPADSYQYVVITSQAMLDATTDYTLRDLLAAKRALGMSATAVTLEDIYASYTGVDQPEQIRNFIRDAYTNWETSFVLLGGDTNVLPYRGLWVNAMTGYALNIPSDMYYQCLDGDYNSDGDIYWGEYHDGPGGGDVDLRPEVYIGRASAETPAEMANFVYKSLTYQNTAGADYRRDAMMLGEWLGFEGLSEYATAYMEEIRLGTSSAGYTTAGFAADPTFTTSAMYDSETDTWSASQLVTQLNSNVHGVYNHLGHANQQYVMKLRNGDVDLLTNDNLFFMYSQGCDPGDFPDDAIAEHFTTSTRHGAAAVVFNAKNGWGARNSTDSPAQRPNREFWDALFSERMNQLGVMNADSHVDVLWGITNNLPLRWQIYQTNLLGDPAAEVVSLDLAVIGSTPRGGDVMASRPVDFAVTFNEPYLGSSVEAGDLRVNGLPADSFTLTDACTLTFHFNTSPVTAQGSQTMSIAAGSVLRTSDHQGNRAWTSRFRYDVAPLQVISTEPANGAVTSLPLTTLRINASEEIDPGSVNPVDLALSQGSVVAAVRADADTVEYTLSGTSQEGTLTVSMAAGALTDIYGNPSAAYSGTLILDWVTTAFPTPLTAKAPLGSLIYDGSIAGHITSTADTDSFTIELDAGQTLTALAQPADGLQPTLAVVGPGGTSGSAIAPGAGQQVFLQTVAASTAGTYTVTVGAAGGTTGGYTLQLILNAAVEGESHAGSANDTFDTAQSLDAAFLALGDTGRRAAVLGALSESTESEDYYRFNLSAGQSASMALTALDEASVTLELFAPNRERLALGRTAGGNRIDDFVATASGTYFLRIGGTRSGYALLVTAGIGWEGTVGADIDSGGQVLGYLEEEYTFYAQRADFAAAFPNLPVEDFEEGRVPAGYTGANFAGPAQYGIANYVFDADDILPGIAIQSDAVGHPSNEMFLAAAGYKGYPSKAIGSSWGSENTELLFLQETYEVGFDVRTGGSTTITVIIYSDADVLGSKTLDTSPAGAFFGASSSRAITRVVIITDWCEAVDDVTFGATNVGGDYYRISATAGDSLRLSTLTPADGAGQFVNSLNPRLELYNASGTLVAANDNGAADGRNAVLNYAVPSTGEYTVRIAGGVGGEYVLQTSGATGAARPFAVQSPTDPAEGSTVVGLTRWNIPFNDTILLSTLQPADLTVDGLAATAVTVSDSRTASFTLPVDLAEGFHTLAIAAGAIQDLQQTPVAAWTCQFALDVSLPRIIASSLQDRATLNTGDLTVAIQFNKPMLATNLDADDLALRGINRLTQYAPISLGYDSTRTLLTVAYATLPGDSYRFTLRSGDGRFEDTLGVDLDGEATVWPIPQNASGNGAPGGDFLIRFLIDTGGVTVQPPLAADEAYTLQDSAVLVVPAPGVLANDSDPEGKTLVPELLAPPLHGTLSLTPDGAFHYAAQAGFYGVDRFIYRVNNGSVDSLQPATAWIRVVPPGLVKDLQDSVGEGNPRNLVRAGNLLYFTATDVQHGTELWKSDGTLDGTVMVKDIYPGSGSSAPSALIEFNGTLYFAANDPVNGTELWTSDGTPSGTRIVTDLYPGASSAAPANLVELQGRLLFSATNGVTGTELWSSDGTAGGTQIVKDICAGSSPSDVRNLVRAGPTVFFVAHDSQNGNELWKTDGTGPGTRMVKDIAPGLGSGSGILYLTAVDDNVFFSPWDNSTGYELWRSDGTEAGTLLLKDIRPGTSGSSLGNLTSFGGKLYFTASDGITGTELWTSDGTPAGTAAFQDICPGASSSAPANMRVVGDSLFFQANDGSHGYELWTSDGTPAGTRLVKDIAAGSSSSTPQELADIDGILYFTAIDDCGRELWRSDGTAAGTLRVKDLTPGISGSSPLFLTNLDGIVFFTAATPTGGRELWRSDGTDTWTRLVRDIRSGTGDASPTALTAVNGKLYLSMTTTPYGTELWQSDGTADGTTLVKDIYSGSNGSAPANFVNADGTLFFTATDSAGTELWRSDGTAAGTMLVKDIYAGSSSSSPSNLTNVNGVLFFIAYESATGTELWKTDGTAAGTMLVKDIYAGTSGAAIGWLTNVGGTLFFRAYTTASGYELWKSDGTAAGTVMVKELSTTGSSSPSSLTVVGNTLFFQATDGAHGYELWKTDGTPEGTVLVRDINPSGSSYPANLVNLNGRLLFSADDGTNGSELWISDGTAAGTVLVRDIWPGATGSSPANLITVGATVFFAAGNDTDGIALWRSNGTPDGTLLVKDLRAGTASPMIQSLTVVGGALYFQADDGVHGGELWRTNGTAEGTTLVADIMPGAEGSDPTGLVKSGRHLYFAALDGFAGRELWELSVDNHGPTGQSDVYTVDEDHELVVPAAGVLANDSDPDGDPLQALLLTGPAHGTLEIDAAGSFRYVPPANFWGADSFTYATFDGIAYSQAISVSITVRSINDPPAGTDSRATLLEDGTYVLTRADFGFADPLDVPSHAFAAVRISDLPRAGRLRLNGVSVSAGQLVAASDVDLGRLTFSPSVNANGGGCASFSFQVQDDGGTLAGGVPLDPSPNTITFDVTPVNDPPVGTAATQTLLEDVPYCFAAADFGFTDPADSPARAMAGVIITTVPSAGVLSLEGAAVHAGQFISAEDLTGLRLRFSAPGNAYGTAYASFTFQVVDDGGSLEGGADFDLTPRTMRIDVTPVNDEPAGSDARLSIVEGRAYPFLTSDFGFTDTSDTPASAFERVWIVTVPAQGSLMLNGISVTAGQSVTAADIQLGRLTYVPADHACGSAYASFTFQVQDDGGTSNAGRNIDATPNTVTIDLARVSLDVDGNGTADALSDGILVLRYLFAPEGQWSYSDAVGSQAARSGRHAIRCFLDGGRGSALDVDGNGTADALTDGILILRYLFAPDGQWSYIDALGTGATRTDRPAIKAFLDQFSPALAQSANLETAGPAPQAAVGSEHAVASTVARPAVPPTYGEPHAVQPAQPLATDTANVPLDTPAAPTTALLTVFRAERQVLSPASPSVNPEPADAVLRAWDALDLDRSHSVGRDGPWPSGTGAAREAIEAGVWSEDDPAWFVEDGVRPEFDRDACLEALSTRTFGV